jgi:hypothetical protein
MLNIASAPSQHIPKQIGQPGAISLKHYTDEELLNQIDAAVPALLNFIPYKAGLKMKHQEDP